MPVIRENIPRYMTELKTWLHDTGSEALEEITGFFRTRLDGYEAHMSPWREAYETLAGMLPIMCATFWIWAAERGLSWMRFSGRIRKSRPPVSTCPKICSGGFLKSTRG